MKGPGTGDTSYQHLEVLPFALAVIRDCRLLYANTAMRALLGFPLEPVSSQPQDLFPEGQFQLIAERQARRLRGEPIPETYETVLRTATGERRVELTISQQGGDTWVLARDLTHRMAHRQLLQRLASLGASLPSHPSEEQVLRRVFEGLAEVELSYGYLVPDARQVWLGHVFVASWAVAGVAHLGGHHLVGAPGRWTPLVERAWQEGSAYLEDLAPEAIQFMGPEWKPPLSAHLRRVGPLPSVCVRIDGEGQPQALLVVVAHWLSEEEIPPLRLFAAQVSAALDAARTISRLSTRNTALAALNRLASVAAIASETRSFFGPAMTEIFELLHCASAFLLLRDEGSGMLELAWSQGSTQEAVVRYQRFPLSGSMSEKAMEEGLPRIVPVEDFPEPLRTTLRNAGRVCVALVPLQVRSRMVGTLVITFSRHHTLSVLERETLHAMGVHFAATLESHRLLQEVRGRAEELTRLHSELKHTQRQLVERERLAALGELSAVVAHEVRNPLGAIFNALATLRHFVQPATTSLSLVNILEEEANRLNRLVEDLLDFARPSSPQPEPVPLQRLLEDAVRTATSGQSHLRVEWALEPDVPPVPVDERMMRQAFLNLALNAVQAMPQGGTLRISARRSLTHPGALVEFTDTGPGIPPGLKERLFEPFFTTKATGTGLGLAIVQRTLEAHGGRITIECPHEGGTTFRLLLPLAPEPLTQVG